MDLNCVIFVELAGLVVTTPTPKVVHTMRTETMDDGEIITGHIVMLCWSVIRETV